MTDTNENTLFDDVLLDDADLENETIATLVGEGKKFKSEGDVVKKIIHSDRHIERLERENAELRGKVTNEKTIEALLDRLTKANPSGNPSVQTNLQTNEELNGQEPRAPSLKTEDVVAQVLQQIETQHARKQQEQNLRQVQEVLARTYGRSYVNELNKLTEALDLSKEEVDTLAKRSPKALFKVLGINPEGVKSPVSTSSLFGTPAPSAVDSSRFTSGSQNGTRNNAFYESLRQKDPKKFFSTEVQVARMRDAERLGSAFFNP